MNSRRIRSCSSRAAAIWLNESARLTISSGPSPGNAGRVVALGDPPRGRTDLPQRPREPRARAPLRRATATTTATMDVATITQPTLSWNIALLDSALSP